MRKRGPVDLSDCYATGAKQKKPK